MKRTENTATDGSMNAARTSGYSGFRKRVTHGRVRYILHAVRIDDGERLGVSPPWPAHEHTEGC